MITSRITGKLKAPDAFGAKTTGVIEADFSGLSNSDINGFRLRHSYIELQWERSTLLLGQYWHPLFVPDVFPNVLALNTGAPFQPFIRSPQISFSYHIGGWRLMASALSQLDYTSEGPVGRSSAYIRDAGIPNMHVQGQFRYQKVLFGVAVDYKTILPQEDLIDPTQSEMLSTLAYMIYGSMEIRGLKLKSKVILGDNLTEHLMLGGYYAQRDPISGQYHSYRPTRHINTWLTLGKNFKNLEFSTFFGYSKKLHGRSAMEEVEFGRGLDIDHCIRIAPLFGLSSGNLRFYLEGEYTMAAYEDYSNTDGLFMTHVREKPGNLRIQASGLLVF